MLTDQLRHWSHGHHGHQAHRQAISASSGQNELGKKPIVLTNFRFLVNFIRHTGPMVTMVTTGHQAHRQAISAFSGRNDLGKKIEEKT